MPFHNIYSDIHEQMYCFKHNSYFLSTKTMAIPRLSVGAENEMDYFTCFLKCFSLKDPSYP